MTEPGEPQQKPPSGAMRAAGAGLELAATLVGCCLAGYWLDQRLDSSPWCLLSLAILGIIGGLYNMIRREVRQAVSPPSHKKKDGEAGGPGGGDQK